MGLVRAAVKENVLRLHVPVDHPQRMRVIERVEEVDRDAVGRLEREPPLRAEHRSERVPVQLLHQKIRQAKAVAGHPRGHDLDDVRVRQLREDARFLVDPGGDLFSRTELGVERLQDVALPDGRVLDLIDRPHPPLTEQPDHLIDGARDDLVRLVVAHRGGPPRASRSITFEPCSELCRSRRRSGAFGPPSGGSSGLVAADPPVVSGWARVDAAVGIGRVRDPSRRAIPARRGRAGPVCSPVSPLVRARGRLCAMCGGGAVSPSGHREVLRDVAQQEIPSPGLRPSTTSRAMTTSAAPAIRLCTRLVARGMSDRGGGVSEIRGVSMMRASIAAANCPRRRRDRDE